MKAIIPVAGVGTKLRPLTYTQPKPLIPIAGKPILSFIIDRLITAGCKEFVFIIGYLGEKIHDFVRKNYPDIVSYFIQQNDRKGLGHAIWMSKNIVNDEEMLIVLGDTVFEADIEKILASKGSSLGVKKVDDPRDFGVADIDDKGQIIEVIEKPNIPKSNMALVGLYMIKCSDKLFKVLEDNIKNDITTHSEIQLTDAIGALISSGEKFQSFKVENWYDCGKRDSLLEANAILLNKSQAATTSKKYPGAIIIEPVNIAKDAVVHNSIIGPNVSVGTNTGIHHSIIKNSIIGEYAKIEDAILYDSIIGNDASIKGMNQSLNIGDNTEIDFR